ncbi:MAG: L,D-transpeptidase family protein [Victivallaceae bacterium]
MDSNSYNYDFNSRKIGGKGKRHYFIVGFIAVALLLLGLLICWKAIIKDDDDDKLMLVDDGAKPVDNAAPAVDNVAKVPLPPAVDENNLTVDAYNAIKIIIENAKKDLAAFEYAKVGKELGALLDKNIIKFASPLWRETAALLDQANTEVIFSDIPVAGKRLKHEVGSGESFSSLASKYNTPIELIQRSNKLNSTVSTLRLGQLLYFYDAKWSVVVIKDAALLLLYDNGQLFKVYNIGTGRQDRTPVGSFVISAKIKNPSWYSPDGKVFEFGAKENILGTRWMALKPTGETNPLLKGYGIHGTWDEGEITRPLSNGCIRMQNKDVEELFAIVPHKVTVIISDSFSPEIVAKLHENIPTATPGNIPATVSSTPAADLESALPSAVSPEMPAAAGGTTTIR